MARRTGVPFEIWTQIFDEYPAESAVMTDLIESGDRILGDV